MATAASYDCSSDLMVHYAATIVKHPASSDITAVYDENQNPLVFSITNDGTARLTMTIADAETGLNSVKDLSAAFGLSQHVTNITSFQDDNGLVYLAFAVATSTTATSSNVYVCTGASPATWRANASEGTLASLLISASDNVTQLDIQRLDLTRSPSAASTGSWLSDSYYPLLVAVYTVQDSPRVQWNVERVRVDKTGKWGLVPNEMTITTDPSKILDIVVGSAGSNLVSLVTLYRDDTNTLFLQATHLNLQHTRGGPITSKLTPPSGAMKLSVMTNTKGFHDLLIGANGLHHFSAEQLLENSSVATQLTDPDDVFSAGVQEMVTSQSNSVVPVWFRTAAGDICSAEVTAQEDGTALLSVPTYPVESVQAVRLCPIFHQPTQSHNFLYLDEDQEHCLLQYKPVNDLWDEQLWAVPGDVTESYIQVSSYSSKIFLKDVNGQAVPNTSVDIAASDLTNVTVNGNAMNLTTTPQSISTDYQGGIAIVSPAANLGGMCVFTLSVNGATVGSPINPATNVQDGLGSVKDGPSLQAQTRQSDGQSIVSDLNLNSQQLSDAGTNIGQLHSQFAAVPANGSILPSETSAALIKVTAANSMALGGVIDDFWKAWHYVERKADQALTWVKNEAGQVIAFTAKIGTQVRQFLVNSVARVLKTLDYVLQQIELDIDKLIDWLGFLFNWKAIEKVKSDMLSVTNGVLGKCKAWSQTAVTDIDNALDSAFGALENVLANLDPTKTTLASINAAVTTGASYQTSSASKLVPATVQQPSSKAISHPASNWTTNQISHGGLLTGASPSAPPSSSDLEASSRASEKDTKLEKLVEHPKNSRLIRRQVVFRGLKPVAAATAHSSDATEGGAVQASGDVDPLANFDNTVLVKLFNDVEDTFTTFANDMQTLFKSSLDQAGAQMTHLVVDFVTNLLQTLKDLVQNILQLAEQLLGFFIDSVNSPLYIPVLSTIYHDFTGNNLPSGLDVLCLLLAIPTSAVGRLIPNGPIWPDLSGFATTFSNLNFQSSSLTSMFNTLASTIGASDVDSTNNTRHSTARSAAAAATAAATGDDDGDDTLSAEDYANWLRYSQGCIVGHFVACSTETAGTFFRLSEKAFVPQVLDSLNIACETVALAFSAPNEAERGESDRVDTAITLDWAAWFMRALELLVDARLSVSSNDGNGGEPSTESVESTPGAQLISTTEERKAASSAIFTTVEFALQLACMAEREIANKADGLDTDSGRAKENTIGMAFGSVFSSALSQLSGDISVFTEGDAKAGLIIAAGVFGIVDAIFELVRGAYTWSENAQNPDWKMRYSAITF